MTYEKVLTTLANPTRRTLFECQKNKPQTVGVLSSDQAVTRPVVSQHLKVLKQAGLVTVESQGTRRIYPRKMEKPPKFEEKDYVEFDLNTERSPGDSVRILRELCE